MEFGLHQQTQDAFCDVPVRIVTSPISCQAADGPLEGCKIVKGCREMSVKDDTCDPINVYWSAAYKTLGWWRN